MARVVSHLQLKALDTEQRILEGWASKPESDRMGDIVESRGAVYKLPIPLLMDHDHRAACGEVFEATVTDAGIRFKAKIAKIAEPGPIKDLCDSAWSAAKAGLRRAVSIGFRALDMEPLRDGGWRFKQWEWHELSLVTVPACAGASIDQIKSIDRDLRHKSTGGGRVVRLTPEELGRASRNLTATDADIHKALATQGDQINEYMKAATSRGATRVSYTQETHDALKGLLALEGVAISRLAKRIDKLEGR